jgi:hypothetical protein
MTNVRVSALLARGHEVLAAVPHAGPGSGVYRSRDGGLTFEPLADELPTVLDLAAHEGRVWAATERGLWSRGVDGVWHRVQELGEGRVDQLAAGPRRLAARAGAKHYQLATVVERLKLKNDHVDVHREKWVEVAYRHGEPRSVSVAQGALWVTDAEGLYRLAEGENHTLPAPLRGGRLTAAGDQLLLTGSSGAFRRTASGSWTELAGGASRALPTGDPAYPVLLLGERGASLLRAGGELVAVDLPIPARDVLAAIVTGGRLLLGSSGYGVLVQNLYE